MPPTDDGRFVTIWTVSPSAGIARVTESSPWWRRTDPVTVGSVLAIAGSGLLMIFSATGHGSAARATGIGTAARQAVWIVLGLMLMAAVSAVDYRRLRRLVPIAYGLCVCLLVFVLTPLGSESKGAQAWFGAGGVQLQPSEFAKVAVIAALAAYIARQHGGFFGRHVAVAVGMTGLPIGLVLLQPDLGTSLVFAAVAFLVILAAGAPLRSLAVLVVVTGVAVVAVVQLGVLQQYQLDRLGAFLDPSTDTQRSAYNLEQSKIAIGSGGITGKGLFLGTQTNLRYVPEQHTDFIFTVVGEELGFLGAATLLVLFAVLLWRMWLIARRAPDVFGALLVIGVLAMFVAQIFQNVGMTMGIMPITGIPLPLVSYGGSSVLTSFLALGLVLNVRSHSR